MITRLWLVISMGWALFGISAASSRPSGHFESIDYLVIAGPFLIGLLLWRVGVFVIHGR